MQQYIVDEKDSGKRLDKFLVENMKDLSRSKIQKLIEDRQIIVNGKSVRKHYFLSQGEIISFLFEITDLSALKTEHENIAGAKNILKKIKIIFDCSDYVVISKPSGLLVHPVSSDYKESITLVHWLLEKYPEIKNVGDNPELRPGIVHRIDKEVSGLLIIAKNNKIFLSLKKQFKDRKVKKEYFALVYGKVLKEEGVINFALARGKHKGNIVSRAEGQEGRASKTAYTVIEYIGKTEGEKHGYTFLNVELITGRSHQIRTHLKAIGHPIVGDNLYTLRKQKKNINLGRVFLHSHKLGFFNLNNEWVEYESPLPKSLFDFIKNIKQ